MPRAILNDTVIAQSDQTVHVEGNHYFPPDSVDGAVLRDSETSSVCPWKGAARYKHVVSAGQVIRDAAWYYPDPSPAASQIAGYVAFSPAVRIED